MATTRDVIAGKARVVFGADFGPLRKGMSRLDVELNSFGRKLQEVSAQFVQIGIASSLAFAKAIEVGAKYEDQISQIKGLLDGTGTSIGHVEVEVRKLGKSTSFTSSQVSGAFTDLKRGGLTAEQAISSLRPALDLARAGAFELGTASRIMASAIKAFNLEGNEAVRVSDLLVQVSNNAGTTVEELGEAFKFVALNGKASGETIENIVKGLGLLGDSALRGGNAGRALSRALERLTNEEAIDKMRKLGVAINQIDPSTGRQEDFIKVLFRLKEVIKGFSVKKQSAILNDIFDVQGKRAVQAIISRTADEIGNLDDKILNMTGTASKFSKEMDNNVGGAFRRMLSAVSDTGIELTKALAEPLRSISRAIITISGGVSEFIKNNKTLSQTLAVTAGGITTLAIATLGLGIAVQGLSGGFGIAVTGLTSLANLFKGASPLAKGLAKHSDKLATSVHTSTTFFQKFKGVLISVGTALSTGFFAVLEKGFKFMLPVMAQVGRAIAFLGASTVGLIASTVGILGYTIYDQMRDRGDDAIRTSKEALRIQNDLKKALEGKPVNSSLTNEKGSLNEQFDLAKAKRSFEFYRNMASFLDKHRRTQKVKGALLPDNLTFDHIIQMERIIEEYDKLNAIQKKIATKNNFKSLNRQLSGLRNGARRMRKELDEVDKIRKKIKDGEFTYTLTKGGDLQIEVFKEQKRAYQNQRKYTNLSAKDYAKLQSELADNELGISKIKKALSELSTKKSNERIDDMISKLREFNNTITKVGIPKIGIKGLKAYSRELIELLEKEKKLNGEFITAGKAKAPKTIKDLENELADARKKRRESDLRFNFDKFMDKAKRGVKNNRFLELLSETTSSGAGLSLANIIEEARKNITTEKSLFTFPSFIDEKFTLKDILLGQFKGLQSALESENAQVAKAFDLREKLQNQVDDIKLKVSYVLSPDLRGGKKQFLDVLDQQITEAQKTNEGKGVESQRRNLAEGQNDILRNLKKRLSNAVQQINFPKLEKSLREKAEKAEAGELPDTGAQVLGSFSGRATLGGGAQIAVTLWRQQLKALKTIGINTGKQVKPVIIQ